MVLKDAKEKNFRSSIIQKYTLQLNYLRTIPKYQKKAAGISKPHLTTLHILEDIKKKESSKKKKVTVLEGVRTEERRTGSSITTI